MSSLESVKKHDERRKFNIYGDFILKVGELHLSKGYNETFITSIQTLALCVEEGDGGEEEG